MLSAFPPAPGPMPMQGTDQYATWLTASAMYNKAIADAAADAGAPAVWAAPNAGYVGNRPRYVPPAPSYMHPQGIFDGNHTYDASATPQPTGDPSARVSFQRDRPPQPPPGSVCKSYTDGVCTYWGDPDPAVLPRIPTPDPTSVGLVDRVDRVGGVTLTYDASGNIRSIASVQPPGQADANQRAVDAAAVKQAAIDAAATSAQWAANDAKNAALAAKEQAAWNATNPGANATAAAAPVKSNAVWIYVALVVLVGAFLLTRHRR